MAYNKYKNIKSEIDGIKFDSLVEANYYKKLKEDLKYGRIKYFKAHPDPTILLDAYQLPGERRQSAIKYNPDFVVVYLDGTMKIIDAKGGDSTPEFKLKKKMFESKTGNKLWEVRYVKGKWVES